jgi:DNA-binding CsgD family transcriptional regulator
VNPARWEEIARLLKAGPISNGEAAARLGCARRTVARVREDLGLPPFFVHRTDGWTVDDFEAMTVLLRGGHRRWRGRHTRQGVPVAGRSTTAYRLSFRLHHGRPPVGRVAGTCCLYRCVAGGHLADDVVRAAAADDSLLTELPAGATHRGMDLVAIRRCLRGPAPWPELSLTEARFAMRFADPGMPSTQLASRLGLCTDTVQRYRRNGVPSC